MIFYFTNGSLKVFILTERKNIGRNSVKKDSKDNILHEETKNFLVTREIKTNFDGLSNERKNVFD